MAPVPGKGLRTPMLVSGDGAEQYAGMLAAFGVEVSIQPGPAGTAISRKLLRSVFYKGLAAAAVEAVTAADAAGCGEWLRGNIRAELAGFDASTLDRLIDGTHKHVRPRARAARWPSRARPPPPSGDQRPSLTGCARAPHLATLILRQGVL
jgi:hypothetical protein